MNKNIDRDKIRLSVVGLSMGQAQSSSYVLMLGRVDSMERIPIVIGVAEAQSIAMTLQGFKSSRPLTHDLIVNLFARMGISMREVFIYKLDKGVFFSYLELEDELGKPMRIDARTSDAVAIAVRLKCPIYAAREVVDKSAVLDENYFMDADAQEPDAATADNKEASAPFIVNSMDYLEKWDVPALNTMLEDAVGNEEYEKAALISKEIKRRRQN